MLTGRESVIRLIGKRRRLLPNRQSLLSSTDPQTFLNRSENGGNENGDSSNSKEESERNDDSKWVDCPVCGTQVGGDNHAINSHLDLCLARGTKRKLSQRSILQFCSQSRGRIQPLELNSSGVNVLQNNPATSSVSDAAYTLKLDGYECNGDNQCRELVVSAALPATEFVDSTGISRIHSFDASYACEVVEKKKYVSSTDLVPLENNGLVGSENTASDYGIFVRIDSPLLLSGNEMTKTEVAKSVDFDDYTSELSLQTFIVGRRFGDGMELNSGTSIFLIRDPINPKDPNAVKVLSADDGHDKILGFIPRELSQYLSPLMDKFYISFKGHILSAPKHAHSSVPIQITCQKNALQDGQGFEDIQEFKSLWRCVLDVQSSKSHLPVMTKYQNNLALLIREVLNSYSHLFKDDEKTFFDGFTLLSDDGQRLFARLYTRKGPWFRMSSILYREISDCGRAADELSEAGYFSSILSTIELNNDDLKVVLSLLNISELQEILSVLNKKHARPNDKGLQKCNHGTRKQDIISFLLSSYQDGLRPDLPNLSMKKTGNCVRISASAEFLFWRAERLFFLNGEQDLSAFLLADLGITKYPKYNCIFSNQIFPDRSDLISYEEAIEVAQFMDESLDENNSELVLRCIEISASRISFSKDSLLSTSGSFLSCFSASWIYSKLVLLGVSFLEREQRYRDAIVLLKHLLVNFTSDRRRGYWTLRLSIDLEHVGCLNESLEAAEVGLSDPWVRAGSRVALQRRVLRLGKPPRRWKTPSFSSSIKRKINEVNVQGRPLSCKTGTKNIFYGEDGERCGVEQLALQYYNGEGGGWEGVHTESGIWLTIFGLLMWHALFADVPNVFRTKFQTAPLDLETDSFYEDRKGLIEKLLVKIQDGMGEEMLITSWESHFGTACRGVNWDRHSLSELRAAITCVGGSCVASICRHLAQDYRSWSSGMPDLLLWRFCDNYSGEAKLVEVKGPRDRLSEQQRAWLLFLMDCGFNVEVCKVSPALV